MKKFVINLLFIITLLCMPCNAQTQYFASFLASPGQGATQFGFNFGGIDSTGPRYYIRVLSSFNTPKDNQYDNITENEAALSYNDKKLGERKVLLDIGAGVTFNIYKQFHFYTGISYQSASTYANYYDKLLILGSDGNYYTKPKDESGVGFDGGIIVGISDSMGFLLGGTFGMINSLDLGLTLLF